MVDFLCTWNLACLLFVWRVNREPACLLEMHFAAVVNINDLYLYKYIYCTVPYSFKYRYDNYFMVLFILDSRPMDDPRKIISARGLVTDGVYLYKGL